LLIWLKTYKHRSRNKNIVISLLILNIHFHIS
jgi:hypothetical protein